MRRRQIAQSELSGKGFVAHDVLVAISGTATVARLALHPREIGPSRRCFSGAVTSQTFSLSTLAQTLGRPGVQRFRPGIVLLLMAGAARFGANEVSAIRARARRDNDADQRKYAGNPDEPPSLHIAGYHGVWHRSTGGFFGPDRGRKRARKRTMGW